MNATSLLPDIVPNLAGTTLDSSMENITREMTSSLVDQSAPVTKFAGMITETIVNGSLSVNATSMPEAGDVEIGFRHIIVILGNIVVFFSIALVCFLAYRHKKWETKMRRKLEYVEKDTSFNYDMVDIAEEDEDEDDDYLEMKTIEVHA